VRCHGGGEDLRQDVEKDDTEDRAGAEPEQKVEPVAEAQGGEAAETGREEGQDGEGDGQPQLPS
jgi:hypothetical protein